MACKWCGYCSRFVRAIVSKTYSLPALLHQRYSDSPQQITFSGDPLRLLVHPPPQLYSSYLTSIRCCHLRIRPPDHFQYCLCFFHLSSLAGDNHLPKWPDLLPHFESFSQSTDMTDGMENPANAGSCPRYLSTGLSYSGSQSSCPYTYRFSYCSAFAPWYLALDVDS